MIGVLLSILGGIQRLLGAVVSALSRPVSIPLAMLVVPVIGLAAMWWLASARADKLEGRLDRARADIATLTGNQARLQAALKDCTAATQRWRDEAAAARDRARRAEMAARQAETEARRAADRILSTPLPPPTADGPSIEECRAVDALIRRDLFGDGR